MGEGKGGGACATHLGSTSLRLVSLAPLALRLAHPPRVKQWERRRKVVHIFPNAANTRSGVIGSERTGTPIASNTAHPIAAAVGTCAASPRPRTPVLVIPLATSTNMTLMSGTSSGPGNL